MIDSAAPGAPRSQGRASASVRSSANDANRSARRAVATTRAPAASSTRAKRAPRPALAPVTTATRPSRRKEASGSSPGTATECTDRHSAVRRPVCIYYPAVRAEDLILVSVDDDICEPAEMFDAHVPSRYRDQMPRVVDPPGGSHQWYYGDVMHRNLGRKPVARTPPVETNGNRSPPQ